MGMSSLSSGSWSATGPRILVGYETDAIEFGLREALGQLPRIKTDARVAQVLPVTLGAMLAGAYLGLSRRLSTDLLNLGEPCILNVVFEDHKRDFHPLTLAGYALVLEAVYEFPVDVGVTVYTTIEDDRLHIEREFTTLGDELRMEFIEIRDEKQRMAADELDPGPCEGCEAWCPV
jgi:CRISPR-associated protein Csa1